MHRYINLYYALIIFIFLAFLYKLIILNYVYLNKKGKIMVQQSKPGLFIAEEDQ